MQALIPMQAMLVPQPGRSAGSAGAHSQADSAKPQPSRSAGSAGAHYQAGSGVGDSSGL